jgi:hypothetical protein
VREALLRLVSSMKFWTALLGLLGILGAKYGFDVDENTYWTIVGIVGLLLAGQAATDHGKAAAQVHADSDTDGAA